MSTTTRRSRLHRQEHLTALAFVALPVIGFLLFTLYPMLFSVYASFTNWNGLTAPVFSGLDNYIAMVKDPYFLEAMYNTFFLMLGIPIGLVISLALARRSSRGLSVT